MRKGAVEFFDARGGGYGRGGRGVVIGREGAYGRDGDDGGGYDDSFDGGGFLRCFEDVQCSLNCWLDHVRFVVVVRGAARRETGTSRCARFFCIQISRLPAQQRAGGDGSSRAPLDDVPKIIAFPQESVKRATSSDITPCLGDYFEFGAPAPDLGFSTRARNNIARRPSPTRQRLSSYVRSLAAVG